jgi:hypothetical protein
MTGAGLLAAYARLGRAEWRQRVTRGLRVVKASNRAGLPVRRATIDGVALEFGAPLPAPASPQPPVSGETNEWDEVFNGHSPSEARQ